MRLCAVSVDLDEIPHYFAIHGLPMPKSEAFLVYDIAIGRLVTLASHLEIPLTFFAVGADLARERSAATLRAAAGVGHEIANHSLHHRYDLTLQPPSVIADEIAGGIAAIRDAIGAPPVGFRAPGYTVTDELFAILNDLGVEYDSSVFPCPAYWAAKRAAIALISKRGRKSHSVPDTARVLTAPTRPYRVGTPYWKRGDGIVELPIQVTRGLRLPLIGTSVVVGGTIGARLLASMCIGEPLINLELHGIDLLDVADGLSVLNDYQPDVHIAKSKKIAALEAAITTIRRAGYSFVTLAEAARAFG